MATRGTRAFTDPAELERQVEEYFDGLSRTRKVWSKDANGQRVEWEEQYQVPPTMAGLAHHLGVIHQTLRNYERHDDREEFLIIIARARNRIAAFAEEAAYTREGGQGARFLLEVNHKYGREDLGSEGAQFVQNIIPPADAGSIKAIPKWGEGDDDDDDEN